MGAPIIADRPRWLPRLVAFAAALVGLVAWVHFSQLGLTLSHYDAKAHLVVARRVFDNLTPGWQQVGAVWLPLPHLIALFPVQVDLLYRTGAAGSIVSIASFTVAAWAIADLLLASTGSAWAAVAGAAVFALNPNLLYLQSTPMTEPLLLGLTFLLARRLHRWAQVADGAVPTSLGVLLVLAAWTRYEAWPVVGVAATAAAVAAWRRGLPTRAAWQAWLRLAAWPLAAVALFLVNSRITVGRWFVSDGFFVPDPQLEGRPWSVLVALAWGTRSLSGDIVVAAAVVGVALIVWRTVRGRGEAPLLVLLAPLAATALPFVAFLDGHPYRIRYMVPLVAASALAGGAAVGLARRLAPVACAVLVVGALVASPPLSPTAPMVLEAQWDRPASLGRRAVTACLAPAYDGSKVLASMGSLAHYMQELAGSGFHLSEFIHEGTGVIWEVAMETGPAPHAGWMLVEEQAEGGDELAQRIRRDPAFLTGMTRVCSGGGIVRR